MIHPLTMIPSPRSKTSWMPKWNLLRNQGQSTTSLDPVEILSKILSHLTKRLPLCHPPPLLSAKPVCLTRCRANEKQVRVKVFIVVISPSQILRKSVPIMPPSEQLCAPISGVSISKSVFCAAYVKRKAIAAQPFPFT